MKISKESDKMKSENTCQPAITNYFQIIILKYESKPIYFIFNQIFFSSSEETSENVFNS